MKIRKETVKSINYKLNKGKTKEEKEELLELLKEYRGILTEAIINYLNSLIELEFSVIREYISDSDRKVLAELEIYKKASIYNIYNRTKNLFNQQKGEFIISGNNISGNNNGCERLYVSVKLSDRSVRLFDFDCKEGFIGSISLFQSFENKEKRDAELDRVMSKLERLYDERNPYSSRPGIVGGDGTIWLFEHEREIEKYEEKFRQLDSKKELSDEDKREIEITRHIHDLLLEDFGLSQESFVDEDAFVSSLRNLFQEKTELKKTRVKKMPNLTIEDHIKYM